MLRVSFPVINAAIKEMALSGFEPGICYIEDERRITEQKASIVVARGNVSTMAKFEKKSSG